MYEFFDVIQKLGIPGLIELCQILVLNKPAVDCCIKFRKNFLKSFLIAVDLPDNISIRLYVLDFIFKRAYARLIRIVFVYPVLYQNDVFRLYAMLEFLDNSLYRFGHDRGDDFLVYKFLRVVAGRNRYQNRIIGFFDSLAVLTGNHAAVFLEQGLLVLYVDITYLIVRKLFFKIRLDIGCKFTGIDAAQTKQILDGLLYVFNGKA